MDSYHSLVAWQKAHEFAIKTLRGIDDAWTPKAGAVLHQLRKAVISIEANIVEGYALNTNGYMLKHYRIAFGSAAESEVLLGDCFELDYLPAALVHHVQPILAHCMRALRGLIAKHERAVEMDHPTPHAPRTTHRR